MAITTILFFHLLEKNRNDKYCSTITTVYYVCATFRAKNGPQNRPYIGVKIENMSETWFSALEIISFYQKIEFPRNTRSSCTLHQRSPGPKKVRQSIIILEDSEHPNFTKLFFIELITPRKVISKKNENVTHQTSKYIGGCMLKLVGVGLGLATTSLSDQARQ